MQMVKDILKQTFRPGFVLVVAVFVLGLLGMRWTTGAWEWAFAKKSLPMRRQFEDMPKSFGPYELAQVRTMSKAMERRLSTDHYISYVYRDTSKPAESPESAFSMHVVYYTGNEEPVSAAHVPEVCYVGGGYERVSLEKETVRLNLPDAEAREDGTLHTTAQNGAPVTIPGGKVPVRQFEFLPPNGEEPGSVCYFFVYNGRYEVSRYRLGLHFLDRASPYVYYAKIEVMPGSMRAVETEEGKQLAFIGGVPDLAETRRLTGEFLSHAMPELLACLPRWERVLEQGGPKAE